MFVRFQNWSVTTSYYIIVTSNIVTI